MPYRQRQRGGKPAPLAKEIVVSDEANHGSSDSASLCSHECRSSDYASSSSSNTQSTITEVDDLCALDDLDVTSKPLASALATAHPRASPERSEYTESLERSDQRSSDNRALPPANADIQGARAFAENLRRADVDPSTMLLYRLTGEIAKLTAERTNPISDPIKIKKICRRAEGV